MLDLAEIRRAAAATRAEAGLGVDAATNAAAVTKAVAKRLDVSVKRFRPNRVRGPNVLGTLNPLSRQVHVAERLHACEAVMVEAHELGHYELHRKLGHHFSDDSRAGASPHGTFAAIGYSERERLEAEADAFAIELLCPTSWLRREVVSNARRPADIAAELGLPARDVLAHAVEAVLNERGERDDRRGRPPAWRHDAGRHLPATSGNSVVDCGPGGDAVAEASLHVERLLGDGVPPHRILVLAPSEGTLDAMRTRVTTPAGTGAGNVWSGTPASLGFEILVKNARLADRSPRFRLLDETGARARFEEARRRMAPSLLKSDAFDTVFGAKLRLVDAATWLAAADDDRRSARAIGEVARARVALLLGRTWADYEARLAGEDAIDAADLAAMPVRIMRTSPDALSALRDRFSHLVAVDLQDFGPGGIEMIRHFASRGASTWSVGDPGRCIARHAGARPEAMAELDRELHDMISEATPTSRHVFRVDSAKRRVGEPRQASCDARIDLLVTPCGTADDEARLIAERVEALRQRGVPVRDQVVLAHAHHVLKAVARELGNMGVATTMLPDLRTEDAVEDTLAVVVLATTGDAGALSRIATLPTYALSDDELANARKLFQERAAGRPGRPPTSDGLRRLATDLEGLGRASAADIIKAWLFERSDHLRHVLREPDAVKRDRALATLYHVIRIAEEHEAQGDQDAARLRKRIDRAGGLRQSTAFGRAAAIGAHEALRLMTIHAARGSLFRAVHVAGVRNGRMKLRPQRGTIHPPSSLAERWDGWSDLAGVEEAMLRVAVSRATEQVHVSGAETYPSIARRRGCVGSERGPARSTPNAGDGARPA